MVVTAALLGAQAWYWLEWAHWLGVDWFSWVAFTSAPQDIFPDGCFPFRLSPEEAVRCQMWGAYFISDGLGDYGKGTAYAGLWLANLSLTWYAIGVAILCGAAFD